MKIRKGVGEKIQENKLKHKLFQADCLSILYSYITIKIPSIIGQVVRLPELFTHEIQCKRLVMINNHGEFFYVESNC